MSDEVEINDAADIENRLVQISESFIDSVIMNNQIVPNIVFRCTALLKFEALWLDVKDEDDLAELLKDPNITNAVGSVVIIQIVASSIQGQVRPGLFRRIRIDGNPVKRHTALVDYHETPYRRGEWKETEMRLHLEPSEPEDMVYS